MCFFNNMCRSSRHTIATFGGTAWLMGALMLFAACPAPEDDATTPVGDDDVASPTVEPGTPTATPVPEGLQAQLTTEPVPQGGNLIRLKQASSSGFVLSLEAEQVEQLSSGGLVLGYDPSSLKLAQVAAGELTSQGTLAYKDDPAGQLRLGFVLGKTGTSGGLAQLTFSPLKEGSSALSFKDPDYVDASLTRELLSAKGRSLGGIRWLGGTVTVSQAAQARTSVPRLATPSPASRP